MSSHTSAVPQLRLAGTERDERQEQHSVRSRSMPRAWSPRKWNEAFLLLTIPVVAVLCFFCCPMMFAIPNAVMSASWFLQILADFNGRR